MPRECNGCYVCFHCQMVFDHPAGIEYLKEGSKLVQCPHCKAKFETLPQGDTNTGVDPRGVV